MWESLRVLRRIPCRNIPGPHPGIFGPTRRGSSDQVTSRNPMRLFCFLLYVGLFNMFGVASWNPMFFDVFVVCFSGQGHNFCNVASKTPSCVCACVCACVGPRGPGGPPVHSAVHNFASCVILSSLLCRMLCVWAWVGWCVALSSVFEDRFLKIVFLFQTTSSLCRPVS